MVYLFSYQDLYQPTIEATLPYGLLSIPLFKHQVLDTPNYCLLTYVYLFYTLYIYAKV